MYIHVYVYTSYVCTCTFIHARSFLKILHKHCIFLHFGGIFLKVRSLSYKLHVYENQRYPVCTCMYNIHMHFKGRGNETYTKYQCCVAEIMCIFPKSSKYRCAILKITTDPPIHQIKFSANFSCHNYGMYVLNMGYRNFISPTCTYVVV